MVLYFSACVSKELGAVEIVCSSEIGTIWTSKREVLRLAVWKWCKCLAPPPDACHNVAEWTARVVAAALNERQLMKVSCYALGPASRMAIWSNAEMLQKVKKERKGLLMSRPNSTSFLNIFWSDHVKVLKFILVQPGISLWRCSMFIVVRGIQRKWDSRSFNTSDSGDTTIKCRTELCFMKNDAVADCAVFSCKHFCSINPVMQLLSKLANWPNYLELCYYFFFVRCLMAIWFRHCDAQSRPHFRKIRNFYFLNRAWPW